ncbi:hypothetical protein HYX01_04340 [Candidatus Woesearchaeota archaeon]|nr:hypothetical protein [Candidatus Woesearchaeota archaeon]
MIKFLEQVPILRRMLEVAYTIALVILISGIVGLVLALPVKLLWNFIFGSLYKINVLQAWALNVLAGILFGQKTSKE